MKIDLSEVNRSAKSPATATKTTVKKATSKFKNPFKRQTGPARDNEGKFTSGSGGLQVVKKLNNKRALSLIAVVALVGGLFVFRSFAGGTNGAFVTEMYQRCYNQMKGSGADYTYWLNRLNKGESRNAVWAAFVGATGKACNFPYPPAAAATSSAQPAATASTTSAPATTSPTGTQTASMTTAQITSLYKEILGRDPSQSEITYWLDKSKTWTSAQIKAHLEASNEGFKKNIEAKLQEARAWKVLAEAHVSNAKAYNDETYKLSIQSVVSKDNMDKISQRVGAVRSAVGQVNGGLGIVKDSAQKAAAIGAAQSAEFQSIAGSLTTDLQSLNAKLKNIEADYNRANKTYEANLKFFEQISDIQRQQANCRAQGLTPTVTGACPRPTGIIQVPGLGQASNLCNGVGPGSSSTAKRNCQAALGVVVDGIWGCNTERAYRAAVNARGSGYDFSKCDAASPITSPPRQSQCPAGTTQTGRYSNGSPICRQDNVVQSTCWGTTSDGKCYYDKTKPSCMSGHILTPNSKNDKCTNPFGKRDQPYTSFCVNKVKKQFSYSDYYCYSVKNL